MSLQKSRYESQSIVNSFNLFVDSGKAAIVGDGRSTGDNYLVHLGDNSIEAEDGEIIRMSLVNFNMFNNIYGVNLNNCKFRVTTDRTGSGGSIEAGEVNIPRKNYKTIGAVALAFAQSMGDALLTQSNDQGGTASAVTFGTNNEDVLPAVGTALNSTDDRLIDITMTFDAAHLFSTGEVFIQCFRQVGDSFALLGALGLDSTPPAPGATPTPTENSFEVTIVDTEKIRVQGYFPAQRMTDPNIYVRCSATSNGLESIVLSDPIGDTSTGRYQGEVLNSNILAKIHRDVEFINFETGSSDEYFINLQQRKLSTLRIFLTDSRSRPLGRPFHADTLNEGTASGLEDSATGVVENQKQNQNGNLFFDAVIKVEIIKVRNPRLLDTTPPPPPLPAREAQSVLTWQDYGRPKF